MMADVDRKSFRARQIAGYSPVVLSARDVITSNGAECRRDESRLNDRESRGDGNQGFIFLYVDLAIRYNALGFIIATKIKNAEFPAIFTLVIADL